MHDILGVLQYESKEMLKVFINEESYFTLDQLNDQIRDFDYGYYSDKNKPSPISVKTLNSNTNILKQNDTYCLFDKMIILMIMEMIKMIMIMIIKMIIIITKGTCGYDNVEGEITHSLSGPEGCGMIWE